LLLSSAGHAQAPPSNAHDVTEFGIYTADLVKAERRRNRHWNHKYRHSYAAQLTDADNSCAQGVAFGFRFTVVGTPSGAIAHSTP